LTALILARCAKATLLYLLIGTLCWFLGNTHAAGNAPFGFADFPLGAAVAAQGRRTTLLAALSFDVADTSAIEFATVDIEQTTAERNELPTYAARLIGFFAEGVAVVVDDAVTIVVHAVARLGLWFDGRCVARRRLAVASKLTHR
jgi:hypothetical protein